MCDGGSVASIYVVVVVKVVAVVVVVGGVEGGRGDRMWHRGLGEWYAEQEATFARQSVATYMETCFAYARENNASLRRYGVQQ